VLKGKLRISRFVLEHELSKQVVDKWIGKNQCVEITQKPDERQGWRVFELRHADFDGGVGDYTLRLGEDDAGIYVSRLEHCDGYNRTLVMQYSRNLYASDNSQLQKSEV